MEKIYELFKKYKINIREATRSSKSNYVSILNYFNQVTIPCKYYIIPSIIKSSIDYCDKEIEKFTTLKKELSELDNREFYTKEFEKNIKKKANRVEKNIKEKQLANVKKK